MKRVQINDGISNKSKNQKRSVREIGTSELLDVVKSSIELFSVIFLLIDETISVMGCDINVFRPFYSNKKRL